MPPPVDSPELRTLANVLNRLNRAKIPSMLTGSMAMNFYGHPRATNDFDIVIEIAAGDEERLFRLFENGFYVSREAIREAVRYERLFNVIDYESVFKVDLIVRKKDPFSEEQFRRRCSKEFAGLRADVISPEDLILAKLNWSQESLSEMQERDIKNLVGQLGKELDYSYLEKWAAKLGFLERMRSLHV